MKKIVLVFLSLVLNLHFLKAQDYLPNKIIFKIKSDYANKCNLKSIDIPELNALYEENIQLRKKFPHLKTEKNLKKKIDLSTIYELSFSEGQNIFKEINRLKQLKFIEYAEPIYIQELIYTPNDSAVSSQYYLNAVKAYQAWDIEKGDTNVVIAIVDTGSDIDHPDLINEHAVNKLDPINGIDDDQDGYIDNYYGWNVASDNNDVSFSSSGHGTNVAGIATATGDNLVGIAGVGFKTRFFTVNIALPNGVLANAYEGLVYAAEHGADIINASWGSRYYSEFNKDIVDYITLEKGALIVAGCGNFGEEIPFYPAAYENVIAVGATIEGDTIKANSNYGEWVDIFAPGENMLTLNVIGKLGINGGTSMASPVVAACAALVKSHFPSYNVEQIRHKLLNTADNIEYLMPAKYQGKLGAGRVNVFRALTENNTPGISLKNIEIKGNDEIFSSSDTISISGDLINYLANASNVNLHISNPNNKVSILNSTISIGTLNSLDTSKIRANPIRLIVNNNIGYNDSVKIQIDIIADNYARRQFVYFNVNHDYIIVKENNLEVTITSEGKIGYSGNNNQFGNGIKYKNGPSLLYEGSFAFGVSETYLIDQFRNENGSNDKDFKVSNPVHYLSPQKANVETRAGYTDAGFANPQNISVSQKNYFYRSGIGKNSVIYVYTLKNNGVISLQNLYAGLFLDWDISNYANNKIQFDSSRAMGISYATDTNLYCGVKLLSQNLIAKHYAIDNIAGIDPVINAVDGLSDAEKFICLSNHRDSAGSTSSSGNDIIDVMAAGPFNLKVDSSISIGFLISVSDSIQELNQEADSVQRLYNKEALGIIESEKNEDSNQSTQLYPNPSSNEINSSFYLHQAQTLEIKVMDIQGKLVFSQTKKIYPKGYNKIKLSVNHLKNGIYFLRIFGEDFKIENKFLVSGK
ncbi:MAG: T9SS C-terminal target domain-containing protein [Bacteroidetes bacterium]|nr:MAG: T9SS C-terminal target domain-containing protein [Bacteroidota bacterium]MBL1145168.1 T9SS C-terminal target domain-containing protein [Bacteroidota bacterium]NOG57964.1 S8 family serine peptidase [Bacteroidota bacterium]